MNKSPDAFRTISEVADDLDLPQHVLRFWETRFSQIKPMKRGGGRRYYRPDDVDLLRGIKSLLYGEGYTIRGVQRLLKEQGNKFAQDVGKGELKPEIIVHEPARSASQDMPGKAAMDVAEYATTKPAGTKNTGLLGKLTGKKTESGFSGETGALGVAEMASLQSTLQELLECKRLLDQSRQG